MVKKVKKSSVMLAMAALALTASANPQGRPRSVFATVLMLPTCNDTDTIGHLDSIRAFYDSSSIANTRMLAVKQRELNSAAASLDPACVEAQQELLSSGQDFVDRADAFVREAHEFSHRYRTGWCMTGYQPGLSGLVFDNKQEREVAFGEVENRHEETKLAVDEVGRRLKVESEKCGGPEGPTSVSSGVTAEAEDTAKARGAGQSSAKDAEWEHGEL